MGKKNPVPVVEFFLPDDVFVEILLRLPVKSLLKFKCLSKSWNSFISSRNFSKKYLNYSKSHSKTQHGFILSDRSLMFKHFSLPCMLLNEPPKAHLFDSTHVVEQFTDHLFVGSCDGLVCIEASTERLAFSRNHLVLWNPATRKAKRLPDFGDETGYESLRSYGFGFDESRDDYKVVAYYFGCTDKYDVLVKIFSLETGELKRIENHCGRWIMIRPPSFVNGKLHWIAETKPERKLFIAYLDLATEKYGILDKPDSVALSLNSFIKPVSKESLYVIYHVGSINVTNVWLVEPVYGIGKTTWTSVYKVTGYDNPWAYWKYDHLLSVLENGEIVFFYKGKIEIFNPSNHSVRYHELGMHQYLSTAGIDYVESLVSPFM